MVSKFPYIVIVISSDIVVLTTVLQHIMALSLVFSSLLLLFLLSLLLLLLLLARVYRRSKRENELWLSCGLGSLCWSLEWLVGSICPLLGEILHFPWLPVKRKAWYKWIVCQWCVEALRRVETMEGLTFFRNCGAASARYWSTKN